MNLKFCAFILLCLIPFAYAEESIEKQANQESVEVKIDSLGDVQLKHVIKDSEFTQKLRLVDGMVSNILAQDETGNAVAFSITEDKKNILIPPSEEYITVEYDLIDELVKIDGVWTMDFSYEHTTAFLIPDGVEMIFVNGKPIYLGEKAGIACHGCYMLLEYMTDVPSNFTNVKWEEHEFLVEIRTFANIDNFEFNQPSKSIKFDVDGNKDFVTAIIPTELLGEPYSLFLDGESVHFNERINNGTHVWLNVRPDSAGELEIIGTTVIPEFTLMIPLVAGFVAIVLVSKFKHAKINGL